MKDWNTISETLRDYQILVKMVHVLFGVYVWELLTSMDFEWDFITGKKKFRWPFIFYIANRYSVLLWTSFQLLLFNHSVQQPFACQAIYTLVYIFGQTALLTTSINLAIRTMAIWSNIFVTAGLTLMILGNAVVIILEVYHSHEFFLYGVGCITSSPDETAWWIRAALLYAMTLDFVVLALSIYKITIGTSPVSQHILKSGIKPRVPQSKLTQILFKHGMIYYLTAFLTGLVSVIFLSLRLNDAMNEMAIPPAQIISTIAACRAVRALANFKPGNPPKPAQMNLHSGKKHPTSINKISTADIRTKESDNSFGLFEVETVRRRDLISSN
ncbi:hypothetical protein CPB83DRAFT_902076 [Crepidotus variabilis]|uniref:Transmembrane protein n=1 Tax=Crepidotus variabilis TaxID=179855 RepID=A0A9P6ETN5_9AGAR|nr:hypothetical protein CPB83DRAFT_902076 [Crepidotus variabilis]